MRSALIDAALRAVLDTDEAPEVAVEEDGGASSDLERNFAGPSGMQKCMAFFERVKTGEATPSCVIDFAFSDGGRLKGDQRQMERCYCFHDPLTKPADELLVIVHAHTTEKWGDRKKQRSGRRLERFTSANVRHARIGDGAQFKQETEGMDKHKEHAGVQEQGCGALWNLGVNAENQVKIAEAGGIEAMVEGMGRHTAHAGVQEAGCRALLNLGANERIAVKISEAGGVSAAQKAVETHRLARATELLNLLRS